MIKSYALVMAGGKGTRLWPESTSKKPKQYLPLVSNDTLLQDTLKRFEGLVPAQDRFIVTVEEQASLAAESARGFAREKGLIFEPEGRNTGPCILLALARLITEGAKEEDVLAIVPSDHVILDTAAFRKTLVLAHETAVKNKVIATIGIKPTFPQTGFGYIKKGLALGEAFKVEAFKEKPDFDTAKSYVQSGQYFWNAGMFVSQIGTLVSNFKKHAPEMAEHWAELMKTCQDAKALKAVYARLPAVSIDYAVMEKTEEIAVVGALFDWNDLGSWDALESVIEKRQDNTILGNSQAFMQNARGNIVSAPGKFVSLIDVQDLLVLVSAKSVTVMPKTSSQKVKDVVEYIKKTGDEGLKKELL